jgi:predicted DNA-binding transcriptional regulator AlpA
MSELLTVDDILQNLSVPRSTWDKWRAKGTAPVALKLPNGQLRIELAEFQAWLGRLEERS